MILPFNRRFIFLTAGQLDNNFIGLFNHVIVGEDIPVLTDYETGPKAPLLIFPLRHITKKPFEKLITPEESLKPRIVERRTIAAGGYRFCCTDIDDSRLQLLGQVRKGCRCDADHLRCRCRDSLRR